jgi:uncharacterized protein YyaL (SSP411 family)
MPNRLAQELSPYLLQHAENPVDWYPWCDEALKLSRDQDKPIFLSIGYSACHWCHVMEHESFESPQIAAILNENFVSIKVDREERPDLDQLYMNAVMALRGGGGGWPLSVFLTPTCEVFFGGTYWPPQSRMGMPGFDHVLTRVLHAYRENREQVDGQSTQITQWLEDHSKPDEQEMADHSVLENAANSLRDAFDFEHGGFGSAPKFPHAMDLAALLRLWRDWPEEQSPSRDELMEMVRLNLKKMAYGGIFDHLGGGFARYSVDEQWLVPHFEKMLYDNGLLATVYFETFRATGDPFYSMIGRKTLDYLQNYMTSPQGGFFCTEDADSEGVEGKFYVWSLAEIREVLDDEVAERFCQLYNVTEGGNFEGENILNMTKSYGDWAEAFGISKSALRDEMRAARAALLEVRDQRIRPGLDDKIICSWNALGISAMCEGFVATGNEAYLNSAIRSFEFVWSTLQKNDGQLIRLWRNGVAKQPAFLDDYSYLLDALSRLYAVTWDEKYVDVAGTLIEKIIEKFGDDEPGFFFTGSDGERLIARTKDLQDSSVPSGNSMAATVLLNWGRLCGRTDWIERSQQTIQYGSSLMRRSPLASGQMLVALKAHLSPSRELVILLPSHEDSSEYFAKVHETWRPHTTVICRTQKSDSESDSQYRSKLIDQVIAGKVVQDGQPTLYVCEQFACQAPIVGKEAVLAALADCP